MENPGMRITRRDLVTSAALLCGNKESSKHQQPSTREHPNFKQPLLGDTLNFLPHGGDFTCLLKRNAEGLVVEGSLVFGVWKLVFSSLPRHFRPREFRFHFPRQAPDVVTLLIAEIKVRF